MGSMIAWLDTSAEEQRRMRELLRLFADRESRDELGIGQLRDTLSDLLFPGTSVLRSRARYFLFVPWLLRAGAARGHSGARLLAWVQRRERELIPRLIDAGGELAGLIGRRAGPQVKILPSTIYWSGLMAYGIVANVAPDRILVATPGPEMPRSPGEELADRTRLPWHPTLPPAPAGFPDRVDAGLALDRTEATWLGERVVGTAPGSLLAHLVTQPDAPVGAFPWDEPACADASPRTRTILRHARLLSLTLHGAALLYNLLVAERCAAVGHEEHAGATEAYRELLAGWADECAAARPDLTAWDRADLWALLLTHNPRIGVRTSLFVNTWLDAVRDGDAQMVADDGALRRLVAERERAQKGAVSRLGNDRMLRAWNGASGTTRIGYRWAQVTAFLVDLKEGLATDAGA